MLTASGLMPMPAHLAPENSCELNKVVKPSFMRGFKVAFTSAARSELPRPHEVNTLQ